MVVVVVVVAAVAEEEVVVSAVAEAAASSGAGLLSFLVGPLSRKRLSIPFCDSSFPVCRDAAKEHPMGIHARGDVLLLRQWPTDA